MCAKDDHGFVQEEARPWNDWCAAGNDKALWIYVGIAATLLMLLVGK